MRFFRNHRALPVSGGVKMYKKCRFENAGKKRAVFQATGASRLPETG